MMLHHEASFHPVHLIWLCCSAGVGDSRAVICQGCGAFQPVQDHTPLREDERVSSRHRDMLTSAQHACITLALLQQCGMRLYLVSMNLALVH